MNKREELLNQIKALQDSLRQLTKEEHATRPLPDYWKVGQKVKLLVDKEWFADKGTIVRIVSVPTPEIPANKYQILYTDYLNSNWSGTYHTTSEEIELYE